MNIGRHLLTASTVLGAIALVPTRAALFADVRACLPMVVDCTGVALIYSDTTSSRKRSDSSKSHRRSSTGRTVRSGSSGEVVSSAHAPRIMHVRRQWSVQVAGYETLDAAEAMQSSLRAKGYDARIVGNQRPFDVRIGHYRSSDSALKVARRLHKIGSTVFVTPAEPLPPAIAKRVMPGPPRRVVALKSTTTQTSPTSSPRAPRR